MVAMHDSCLLLLRQAVMQEAYQQVTMAMLASLYLGLLHTCSHPQQHLMMLVHLHASGQLAAAMCYRLPGSCRRYYSVHQH